MAFSVEDLRDAPPGRYILPLVVLIVPGVIYALLTEGVFATMTPVLALDIKFLPGLEPSQAKPSLEVLGADLKARYAFGLATSAFLVWSVATLFILIWRLTERWGLWLATAALVGCLFAGIAFAATDLYPLRELVSGAVLRRVGDFGAPHMSGVAGHIAGMVTLSEALGVAAIVAMVLRFADIAFEPSPDHISEETLRRRINAFRNALVIGGLLLALSVASAHAFYHYPASLLTPDTAKHFKELAGTTAAFFGAMYSGILLLVAVPCYASISSDAAVLAEAQAVGSHAAREKWMETEGLRLAPRQTFTSLLAMAAPILTGPALDLLNALPG